VTASLLSAASRYHSVLTVNFFVPLKQASLPNFKKWNKKQARQKQVVECKYGYKVSMLIAYHQERTLLSQLFLITLIITYIHTNEWTQAVGVA
jgi:hypothetical protein